MDQDKELHQEIKRLNNTLTRLYAQGTIWQAFWRGIFSGLGSVLGATIVLGFIVYLLRQIDVIPIVGDWLSQVFSRVLENVPQK